MKVWISKYALTDGVVEREMNEHVSDNGTRYAIGGGLFLSLDRDAHERQEAALKAAEAIEAARRPWH